MKKISSQSKSNQIAGILPQIQDNSDFVIDKEPFGLKEELKKSDENVSAKGLTPGKVIITAEMFNSKQK